MLDRLRTFDWTETRRTLRDLAHEHALTIDDDRRAFRSDDAKIVVRPPLVLPIGEDARDLADYLAALPELLPSRLVVQLQAGASALGLWDNDELIAHKCSKRYVKRGRGRAQPTHLKTKGKSRYGSRLRLLNARRLLEEIHVKLGEWLEAHGEPELLFYSCAVRLWSDLWHAPAPASLERDRFRKIPVSTRVPCFEELVRVEATLRRGRIEAAVS